VCAVDDPPSRQPLAMTEEQYTRCPSCKTVFRVTEAQLALRDGIVRCGHCQTVFDGRVERIALGARLPDDDVPGDESTSGPPTVTLRSPRVLQQLAPAPESKTPAAAGDAPAERSHHISEDSVIGTELAADYDRRFAWDKPVKKRRLSGWVYVQLIPLLLLLLVAQAAYHYRESLAAYWPAARPVLTRACGMLGCEVRPLRDVAALSIDASDLQVDPAHKGLLVLTATVRNRAVYPIAYPYVELTLTEPQNPVVVRRAFSPDEYLGGTADVVAGLSSNDELALKLFIDASATALFADAGSATQAGYRLYLFYP
jgi:predicted Zn finger-like uncharacterized protein